MSFIQISAGFTNSQVLIMKVIFSKMLANSFETTSQNSHTFDIVITIHWLFCLHFPAVIEPDSVEVNSVPSTVNLCGSTNNQVLVTCQVSIDNVSPAPIFSFSLDGLAFENQVPGTNTGSHYQGQFYPNPTVGGEYQVTCRVTNTVLPNTRHESQATVIFRSKLILQFCSEVFVNDFMC